jgi:hypothetical protein
MFKKIKQNLIGLAIEMVYAAGLVLLGLLICAIFYFWR